MGTEAIDGPGTHRVGLLLDARGPRSEQALDRLRRALDGGVVGAPEDDGTFEVCVRAASFDEALGAVWNAVAAAGVDDALRFTEHPDLPEHWRHRAERPA
ncbi:MAG TPA: hypothetical protein VD931_14755 [Baekduia sp.]|nr:hypothetical protein [Baekduia sp.]